MKRKFLGILAATIVVSAGATNAFAADFGAGRYFADTDGDGVCDNANNMCIYGDADGICDNCGMEHWYGMAGSGYGGNFVDADGDGICDNYASGRGRGNGTPRGSNGNFVDADGDGICDNYASGRGRGGCGRGFRGGRGR